MWTWTTDDGGRPAAIVTGSSSGIGAAIAAALDEAGAGVVVNSASSVREGEALAAGLRDAVYVRADVGDAAQARRLVDTALGRWGRLDLVVNNAGATRLIAPDDLDAVTDEVWEAILRVNVIGTWHVIQAAVPALRRAGTGHIINVSSFAALRPQSSSLPYAVSKAAVNHMTAILARTLGPEIRVNAVAPGLIDTRWTEDWDKARDRVRRRAPLRRAGRVQDVAAACLALLQSPYTTGHVLPVDGGLNLR